MENVLQREQPNKRQSKAKMGLQHREKISQSEAVSNRFLNKKRLLVYLNQMSHLTSKHENYLKFKKNI